MSDQHPATPPADDVTERLQRAVGDTYRLDRELGGGGMSRVFVATEVKLNRKVVLKLLAPELTSDVMTARFTREFEMTALLQHPNILPVLATGTGDGLLYYVMPFVEGESLRHRLEREPTTPLADVVRILYETADALDYAHRQGIVHRDIKPENILLSHGRAILADFGIAAALGGSGATGALAAQRPTGPQRLTELGTSIGTPAYMSPEQAAGERDLDGRSDIYSLGIVGYEMLTGRPPFTGTARSVIAAHLSQPPKAPGELRADTPPDLAAALLKALAKDPADRFASAAEFRDALTAPFSGEFRAPPAPAPPKRRRVALGVAVAAVAAAIAATATIALRGRAHSTADANLLAVAPFEVLVPELGMWKEGIVDVLSSNLDGMGPLHTVPPTVVVRRWSGRPDAPSAAALAKQTGAGLALVGRMDPAGPGRTKLTATLYGAGGGRVGDDIILQDSTARVDRLADSLTVRVLRALTQTRAIASVREAPLGSASLPALKAYLQGEQYYRRSDWDSAAAYYRKALEADSTFVVAMRRLGNALTWRQSGGDAATLAAYEFGLRAGTLNHGLAPRESLLVLADSLSGALALRGQRPVDVNTVARRLIATLVDGTRRFPTDPEIWFKLGDMRHHYGFFVPHTGPREARAAFDQSIKLDSAFAPSYIHLPDLALRLQDPAGARRYIRGYLALEPENVQARGFRALDQLLDPKRAAGFHLDSIRSADDAQVAGAVFGAVVNWMDSAETSLRISRELRTALAGATGVGYGVPPGVLRQMRAALPVVLAARGHLREGAAFADSGAVEATLLPELALLGATPPARFDSVVDSWVKGPPSGYWQIPLAYRWWADRGDTTSLKYALDAMEKMAKAGGPAAAFASPAEVEGIRAHLAVARRDTAEAIRHFATLADTTCAVNWCFQYRLLKAQLLSARKMDREAMAVLDADYAPLAPSRVLWMLERARVAERLGDKPKAIDAYAYVAGAWAHADASLQPAVKEAREGLRRLGSDR